VVEVRYFAGAAEAFGCAQEFFDLPAGSDLRVSAFLVGDDLTRDPSATFGDRVDVLPPFAGG
jgi:molybdopterin synthase sulfur carrier subunit